MAATLNPTIIKEVMDNSQSLRILYYNIRIINIFIYYYKRISVILAKVYLRRHQLGILEKKGKINYNVPISKFSK